VVEFRQAVQPHPAKCPDKEKMKKKKKIGWSISEEVTLNARGFSCVVSGAVHVSIVTRARILPSTA